MNTNIKVATIISTHGLKGQVKVFAEIGSFSNLLLSGKLFYQNGDTFCVTKCKPINKDNVYIVSVSECEKIEDVEHIIRKELFAKKIDLEENGKVLVSDLVGLKVFKNTDEGKIELGVVNEIVNYGQGSMMQIESLKGENINQLYPATFDFIESIDLINGFILLRNFDIDFIL